MKKIVKGFVLAAVLTTSMFCTSCESNEVLPERFADDPPSNNTPQKPPNP